MYSRTHLHSVQIYYEDTDHSGSVYYANYLRYFERAREHMFGVELLVQLQKEQGIGFVVYKLDVTYKAAAHYGDTLEIQTTPKRESDYRLVISQNVVRPSDETVIVIGTVQLAAVNADGVLVALPV